MSVITPEALGSASFRRDHGIRYAYVTGAMYKGIASAALVTAMGRAGLLGYLGTGGLTPTQIEDAIRHVQQALGERHSYGMNLLSNLEDPQLEERAVDLYLRHSIRRVEAAAFVRITPSLVRYRLTGLTRDVQGRVQRCNRVLAKVSRPEVASAFMQPAPQAMVRALVAAGKLTQAEAELSEHLPMADDICVEADSGGHTDRGVAYTLLPAMFSLRDEMQDRHVFAEAIRIGAAGGIGTPEAAAAAFIMGADFVLTGSINQCTVEAGTSDAVKDLLQELDVQDTTYAPAGDMFELGAKVQVARRGLFFPQRANKLYELYRQCESLEDIDVKTRQQIEEKYFRRSFEAVWAETREHYLRNHPERIAAIEQNPKQKMAAIFKWYFAYTSGLALRGSAEQKVDYQIHCGPALGAFNRWVKGTPLAAWRNRNVAEIAELMMRETAALLSRRLASMLGPAPAREEFHPESRVAAALA